MTLAIQNHHARTSEKLGRKINVHGLLFRFGINFQSCKFQFIQRAREMLYRISQPTQQQPKRADLWFHADSKSEHLTTRDVKNATETILVTASSMSQIGASQCRHLTLRRGRFRHCFRALPLLRRKHLRVTRRASLGEDQCCHHRNREQPCALAPCGCDDTRRWLSRGRGRARQRPRARPQACPSSACAIHPLCLRFRHVTNLMASRSMKTDARLRVHTIRAQLS